MFSALKTLVLVASILGLTAATNERTKRAEYYSVNPSPWQSPTSYGFRPNNNYYNIPSTKISRVNSYSPQDNQLRNAGQNTNLYSTREQNSDWIPIISNQNQQNVDRYRQNQIQKQRVNQYNIIRSNDELLDGRIRQRQPNYSLRGGPVNADILREINSKLLAQAQSNSQQSQLYGNVNQEAKLRGYAREANRETNQIYSARPLGQSPVRNIQGLNPRYPVQHPIEQQYLKDLLRAQQLPAVEGRILGLNGQEVKPVQELNQDDAEYIQQIPRIINNGHLPIVQRQISGEILRRPEVYAVQEINGAEQILNEQKLREIANRESLNVRQQIQSVQEINEPSSQLKQILREATPENLVRSEELQEPNGANLRNYIQGNNPSGNLGQRLASSGINQGYPHTLALINSNRDAVVLEGLNGNILGQQIQQQNVPTSQIVKVINVGDALNYNIRVTPQVSRGYSSELLLHTNQGLNDAWRQNEQLGNLRNIQRLNLDQENRVQDDGNQRPNVYSYAELTAKIWKVIKDNPAMMSDLGSLREQLLNERESRNAQIRELRGLLEEARKYNRNSASSLEGETLEQKQRNAFLSDLIDTMNKNEASSNSSELRRQLSYLGEDGKDQARFLVRPRDVNPLIKNILFETSRRNETEADNAETSRAVPIIVRPNTSQPLPQLSVGRSFDLERLEHHYDLTHWKQVTEALGGGNPFLQDYNVLQHLV